MGRFRTAALLLLCLAFASTPSTARAVEDEVPTCEDVLSCVVFDPAAAAPGTTVTITPVPYDPDYPFIPIVAECSPSGRLWIELLGESAFTSPLVGDDQLARFSVPEMPPGEYEAVLFCSEIDYGMGVGVFRVLAVETPQGTPTPTPDASPTPMPTPTTHGAVIGVVKSIDGDGNPDTIDDQIDGEGFEFEVELTDGTVEPFNPVTDEFGFAEWGIEFGPDGTTATVTEVPREGFELVSAFCAAVIEPDDDLDGFTGDLFAELDGDSVTFRVDDPIDEYQCEFFNVESVVLIGVLKYIDADRNLDSVEDQTEAGGWEFDLELTDGTIVDPFPVVTDEGGFASWVVSFGPDGTTASVTEVVQVGFELVDAACFKITDTESLNGLKSGIAATGQELVGELAGDSVTFRLDELEFPYQCFFFNAPSPEDGVGGETAVPPNSTLPPTDTGGSNSEPSSGSWRVMLIVLAVILAGGVVLKSRRAAGRSIT